MTLMKEAIKIKSLPFRQAGVQSDNPFKSVIQKILSYDIVMAHGGGLTVESQVGNGSQFKISIPSQL